MGQGVALRVLASLAIGVVLGGCSFVFVDRAPPRERWPVESNIGLELDRCTASPWLPIVDGTLALGIGAGAVAVARRGGDADPTIAGLLMVPALVYLASGLYGLTATNHCRTYLAGPPYAPDAGR
jgi:hypothetical protein